MKKMIFLMVWIVAMWAGVGFGQGWYKVYQAEGSQGDIFPGAQSAIATPDGGFFVAATSDLYQGDGVENVVFFKTDAIGNRVIDNLPDSVPSIHPVFCKDLVNASDGGYIICTVVRRSPTVTPVRLIKLDESLNVEWKKDILEISIVDTNYPVRILQTNDGGYAIVGSQIEFTSDSQSAFLIKTDSEGNEQWSKSYQVPFGLNITKGVNFLIDNDQSFVITGWGEEETGNAGFFLLKADPSGNEVWQHSFLSEFGNGIAYGIAHTTDNAYIMTGYAADGIPICMKVSSEGNLVWQKNYEDNLYGSVIFTDIIASYDDGFYITGYGFKSASIDGDYPRQILLLKIDEEGNELWRNNYRISESDFGIKFILNNFNKIVICGTSDFGSFEFDPFLFATDSLGNLFSSALTGTLHLDPQSDCLPDTTEAPLAGWLVQAIGADLTFSALTDTAGHFLLPLDTAAYEVTVTPPGPYWEVCNSPTDLSVIEFYDTLLLDFAAHPAELCPYLDVSISAPFLRRCFDNHYSVNYCNYGTVLAENAYVQVTLDSFLTYVSSTLSPASQNGQVLTFDLGEVAVNECGDFQITAYLNCDSTILGQTHCTEAHIFPDSLCIPTSQAWDGSSIEVSADCTGDSVVFTIQNAGTGGMAQPLGFIIIEDQIVLLTDEFQLGPGQVKTVTLPASGTTLHLEAQQSAEHPSGDFSTGATVEGCGGWFSIGFFTQFTSADGSPFVDIVCQANIGSFDPNDKQAYPAGFTDEHLIEPQDDIEYLIRFQNTGTDTAFKVVVVDVLPPELDLATVRPGAASHPYTYSVSPEGWLIFTFENILLPDSMTNETASHGFIRLRVSQRPGNGWGTTINNTALIYFDFNQPVQTNTYQHRVGRIYPWTIVGTHSPKQQKTQLKIIPNPLTDSALLQLEGVEAGQLKLTLTDVAGRILRQEEVFGTSFEFQRNDLPAGLYFFKIERNGKYVTAGKMVVK